MSLGFDILHEDSACLVASKPGGLLTQAPLGIDSLELRVKRYLKEHYAKPGGVYLGVPHRIDRPVSGVIVFAKNVRAARRISEQFEGRLIAKTYWALVPGEVSPSAATWTDYLQKIDGEPRSVVVDERDSAGRIAILHYRVLQSLAEKTLLEITLETGRTHQIRVQCASRGLPLLGDQLYGSTQTFGPWSDDERQRLIALHARTLAFRHPTTRELVACQAPLPAAWGEVGIVEAAIAPSQPGPTA